MQDPPDDGAAPKSATQVLAELVARRKAASHPAAKSQGPHRQAERAAAARSASKSKPAMKKP
ncbi:hypothetical protein [Caulobacter sp. S45]|uniref:hypothetical protein n=1 Tax=Caulobacter sp. S45 TaxID=1641861 RepID=UPI00157540B5|nr:hypothetical protein [Caulobacter sp. S45]